MATILHIAGHGTRRNGSFDPGATGFITQGEWRYYANEFFGLLKKYEPKGHKVIYHTAYNVYDYGNIVNLAKQYGKDTIVIEWHFDATGTPNAHGGHVIVYSGFVPDELDLRLRDGIKDMVGVRYNHRGHQGISGRSNLANVNRAANNGINFRLMEIGFGTSPRDSKVMINEMDKFAKVMSESIYNTEIKQTQQQSSMAGYHVVKSGDTLWAISRDYGVTVNQLKDWNKLESDLIFPGQSLEVQGGDVPLPKPAPKPKETPAAKPSNPIKVGAWVRVPANKLYGKGDDTSPVKSKEHSGRVETINNNWKNELRLKNKDGSWLGFARISDVTGGTQSVVQKQTAEQVAQDIASGRGNWGNDPQRSQKLRDAGYDAQWVQDRVNTIIRQRQGGSSSASIRVGDTIRVKALYSNINSTKNARTSPISGYVASTTSGGRNPIRLLNKKGGYVIGYTRAQDRV